MVVRWICLVLIFCLSTLAGAAENGDGKSLDTERLLTMTGALKVGQQLSSMVTAGMIEAFKKSRPDLPARGFDIVKEEIQKVMLAGTPDLVDRMIAIHDKYYTHEETKALISFYESPLGKKVISITPAALQESMQAGREWMAALEPLLKAGIEARLKKEGILPADASMKPVPTATGPLIPVSPPSADQPRSLLVGTWYGETLTKDGEKERWIDQAYTDGTYKTRFRTYRKEGGFVETTEAGYWGICGSIYFSIFDSRIENNRRIPVDRADAGCYDAYAIIRLTQDTFEYKHVSNGHRYLAKKVGNDFQFPQSSP